MSANGHGGARRAQRVLVVRLGSMGDIVHALPTLATLKENFPAWDVDWLVERRWRELLLGNPCLSNVIEFDTLGWRSAPLSSTTWQEFYAVVDRLCRRKYDIALDLQGSLKSAIACRLSGAARIIGLERPWLREPAASVFYTRRVVSDAEHIVEANLALAAAVGASRQVMSYPLPPGDDSTLPPHLTDHSYAVMNPGAGWASKQWPTEDFVEICDELERRYSLRIVLNCGPGEMALADVIGKSCQGTSPAIFHGGVAGLIALLRRAQLMIGPDTGPVHLAAALGVPTVALFGPTDPKRNGPRGARSRVIRPSDAETSYRHSHRPDGGMERIRPSQVLEAIQELIGEGARSATESDGAAC